MSAPTTLLAFDVGAKRIGVAVGNTVTLSAREVGVLDVLGSGPDWVLLDRWVKEWQPQALVVGDPVPLDGGDQPARQRARGFARTLAKRYALPVEQVDETLSSREAAQRFAAGRASGVRKKSQAATLDALAAVVILERWLTQPQSRHPLDPGPPPP
jgi:putative Holliday junction resolvase